MCKFIVYKKQQQWGNKRQAESDCCHCFCSSCKFIYLFFWWCLGSFCEPGAVCFCSIINWFWVTRTHTVSRKAKMQQRSHNSCCCLIILMLFQAASRARAPRREEDVFAKFIFINSGSRSILLLLHDESTERNCKFSIYIYSAGRMSRIGSKSFVSGHFNCWGSKCSRNCY